MIEGRFGAWSIALRTLPLPDAITLAERMRGAGFGTLWVPGGQDTMLLDRLGGLLAAGLPVASGVLVTWRHPVPEVVAWVRSLDPVAIDRLALGIGVSHGEIEPAAAVRPVQQIRDYLDELHTGFGNSQRPTVVVGALGPVMARLAAERSDGVHPYHVSVAHTERTRQLIGAGPLLAPEQAVVLETDPGIARGIARDHLALYLERGNYVRSWLRQGFEHSDLEHGGSDRLIDALVAWGSDEQIAQRVDEHLAAGADHVAVQVLQAPGAQQSDVPWERLGAALRSSQS